MGDNAQTSAISSDVKEWMTAFAQELVDLIVDELATDRPSLKSCSLVGRSWMFSSRRFLFNHGVEIQNSNAAEFLSVIQSPLCTLYPFLHDFSITPNRLIVSSDGPINTLLPYISMRLSPHSLSLLGASLKQLGQATYPLLQSAFKPVTHLHLKNVRGGLADVFHFLDTFDNVEVLDITGNVNGTSAIYMYRIPRYTLSQNLRVLNLCGVVGVRDFLEKLPLAAPLPNLHILATSWVLADTEWFHYTLQGSCAPYLVSIQSNECRVVDVFHHSPRAKFRNEVINQNSRRFLLDIFNIVEGNMSSITFRTPEFHSPHWAAFDADCSTLKRVTIEARQECWDKIEALMPLCMARGILHVRTWCLRPAENGN